MSHIAFFGHNPGDAAVRRRAVAFRNAGCRVTGFMPRRGPAKPADFPVVDLGETRDNAYLHRLASIFTGAGRALKRRDLLAEADLLYARNLDMLATAALVRRRAGLAAPLVYECLDVHHKLTSDGLPARALRGLERRLLRGARLLVVSSPAFEREYFARHHAGAYRHMLVENRLIEGDDFPPRPEAAPLHAPGAPLRLGWFGNLRCARSLDLLKRVAAAFPDRLEIDLRGYAAPGVFEDFEGEIAGHANIRFGGRYRAPQDLAGLYGGVDLVWAGDWYEAGANSLWLLPNRIYEGGYFATPPIAPAGTETARWIERRGAGFTIAEPVEETLKALIARLIADREPIAAARGRLLALERTAFVEDTGTVTDLLAAVGLGR